MPLLIAGQIIVKPVSNPDGAALLLRSTPNFETGETVESQWYLQPEAISGLVQTLQEFLNEANPTENST